MLYWERKYFPFLLSPESKLYPSNFGPQIWFRPITPRVPRVAYVTSMQPPDILSYRSSASLEFRALQMSPTFHFFDVHAWCCLYFFGITSRDTTYLISLSYLPSSILALQNSKMLPTFHFFYVHAWSYLHIFGFPSGAKNNWYPSQAPWVAVNDIPLSSTS